MPLVFWILTLAPLVVTAWVAGREPDPRQARRLGLAGASVSVATTLAAYGGDVLGWQGGGWLAGVPTWSGMPAYVCLIGLIAVGLSPVRCIYPGTVSRILQVTALSVLAVGVSHPVAMIAVTAVAMVPIWLELGSRVETRASANVFGWYMVPSAVLMLAGAVLYQLNLVDVALPMLCLGIVARAALVPCHSWLTDLVEHAPMGIVTVFVAPQLGVCALLRLTTLGLAPEAAHLIAVLGAVTAVYAAAIGVGKSRTRRALGYLVMSQGGLVVMGFAQAGTIAWTGTLLMAMVVGLASSGYIMAVAALEARRGPLTLDHPTGSFARIPRLATAFLVLGLACVGLPGTTGFVAEDLVVQGAVEGLPWFGVALLLAAALNGISVIKTFFMLFTGTARHHGERDLTLRELWVFTVVLALLLGTGLFPAHLVHAIASEYERGGAVTQVSGQ
jgi:NADH-quinone oxidoreductase subunit M